MKAGFKRIFWGLLFVALDIRINSIDLILPDFVGYILIASGLSLLVPYDQWFRRARLIAIIMIFVSLPSLIEIKVDSKQAPKFKRQLIATLTGDLSFLLPQQVDSAELLRSTSSRNAIDANRTHNPERDEDMILGEYSDGTVVLILRYSSSDEALQAMEQKGKTEYSSNAIRKRAETDESFRAQHISFRHGSSSFHIKDSAYSNVEVADRVIQQWWNRDWIWWNPASWGSSRLLYIVEGHRASADAYKSAFDVKSEDRNGITFYTVFPVSPFGELLSTLLVWGICSGIVALSLSSNNFALMKIAKRRRTFSLIVALPGLALSILWFVPSETMVNMTGPDIEALAIVYVLAVLLSALLIMGLMRRAANSLGVSPD